MLTLTTRGSAFPPRSFVARPARCSSLRYGRRMVKAGQVHEKEFESVSNRDGPYQEDCLHLAERALQTAAGWHSRSRSFTVQSWRSPMCDSMLPHMHRPSHQEASISAFGLRNGLEDRPAFPELHCGLLFRRHPRPTVSLLVDTNLCPW